MEAFARAANPRFEGQAGLTGRRRLAICARHMTELPPPADPLRRRLLYRATHRGSRENDLLVGGFVAARIGGFSAAELAELAGLLECPDPELNDWLTGRTAPPVAIDTPLLRAMMAAARR